MKNLVMMAFMFIFLSTFFSEIININLSSSDRDMFYEEMDFIEQKIKHTGYFSLALQTEFKASVASKTDKVGIADITITTDGIPKYRQESFNANEYIEYTVSIKHNDLIKYNSFWRIPEENTYYIFQKTRVVASEVLSP